MIALSECKAGTCTISWLTGKAESLPFLKPGHRVHVIQNAAGHVLIRIRDGRRFALSADIAKRIKVKKEELQR